LLDRAPIGVVTPRLSFHIRARGDHCLVDDLLDLSQMRASQASAGSMNSMQACSPSVAFTGQVKHHPGLEGARWS
jgi:hypothetical protein